MAEEFTEEFTAVYEMGHMGAAAAALVLLFTQAATLPEPTSASVYGVIDGHVHDHVTLQFAPRPGSAEALAIWATMFGGVIESSTEEREDGPELWVSTSFPWMHLEVKAFAHIPLPQPEVTIAAETGGGKSSARDLIPAHQQLP